MEDLAEIDVSKLELQTKASQILEDLSYLSSNLRNYLETIEFNPARLKQVEDRIELINNLKRKYGETIDEILVFLGHAEDELESINNAGDRIQELKIEYEGLLTTLRDQGLALSQKRQEASIQLQEEIESELADLKMSEARIRVDFQRRLDPEGILLPDGDRVGYDSNGFERVEFFIETNPGEGFKPLVKIASGGETSRFMLALKNVLARADEVPTLVFDEIDQGIGGRVGAIVGQKLRLLSSQHQVLCITHLPQLAGYGKKHFRVEKSIEKNRTRTQVQLLQGDQRLQELAQMLGEISPATLQSAQEILDTADKVE
jgi:DNA repair protein RecN (Recombination protein N)